MQPIISPQANSQDVKAYAGTATERAGDLLWALEDDDIKAIICSRGGYGTLHLLRLIPREKFREHPKWSSHHSQQKSLKCSTQMQSQS